MNMLLKKKELKMKMKEKTAWIKKEMMIGRRTEQGEDIDNEEESQGEEETDE